MKFSRFFIIALAALIPAYSFSIDTESSTARANELIFEPELEFPINPFQFSVNSTFYYGISDQSEISIYAPDMTLAPYFLYRSFWAMFRYNFGNGHLLGLKSGYSRSGIFLSPQYYFSFENDWFLFRLNAFCETTFYPGWIVEPGIFLTPGFKLGFFGVELEIKTELETVFTSNASVTALSVHPVPEIFLDLGKSGLLKIGCDLGNIITTYPSYKFILKYSHEFDLSGTSGNKP